jgi:hypothetical protein
MVRNGDSMVRHHRTPFRGAGVRLLTIRSAHHSKESRGVRRSSSPHRLAALGRARTLRARVQRSIASLSRCSTNSKQCGKRHEVTFPTCLATTGYSVPNRNSGLLDQWAVSA